MISSRTHSSVPRRPGMGNKPHGSQSLAQSTTLNQPKPQTTQRWKVPITSPAPNLWFWRWSSKWIILRPYLEVRRVRPYLCLHPVHWRFSSSQWNGLPALYHSCCLHPTPGFLPSDTMEGTFLWRPPVHATRDQHSSSAPWFAPKHKARRMWTIEGNETGLW